MKSLTTHIKRVVSQGIRPFVSTLFLFISLTGFSQSLHDYYEQAAKNNPGLLAKYAVFEAALTRTSQVNALPDPTLSFGVFISPVETRVGPQQARISLAQMFPWFGTLAARENVAALQAEAAYQEFLEARNQLYYDIATAYYPLYEQQQLLALEQANIEILESYKRLSTSRFENGKGPMANVLRVELLLNEARTRVQVLEGMKSPLTTAFNRLLNVSDSTPVEVMDSLPFVPFAPPISADTLFANHPRLNRLQKLEEASKAQQETARKMGYPSFGVGLDYVFVGQNEALNSPDNGKDVVMPMVSMTVPLYRSKYRASEKEAQLMTRSFQLQGQELTNQLQTKYRWATYQAEKQSDLLKLYQQQIQVSKQTERLLTTAYGNSGQDFEEVLRMQQQVLTYRKQYVSTLTDFYVTLAQLDYLTAKSY